MRGETREVFVWFAIILVVLGVILFGVATKLGGEDGIIQGIQNFLPSFKDSEDVLHGKTIVGVQFGSDELKYYDGSRWRVLVPKDDGKYHLEGKIFGNEVRDELINFYTNTERFGAKEFGTSSGRTISIENVNPFIGEVYNYDRLDQLYGSVDNEDYVTKLGKGYQFAKKGIYVNLKDSSGKELFLGLDDNIYYVTKYIEGDWSHFTSYSKMIVSKDKDYASAVSLIRSWRDQIAESGKCEKFVRLTYLDEKGIEQPNYYSVVRNGEFIYVDLDEPATGVEKYYSNDCAGVK